jgi:predicted nucleic acid-binding protein
MSDKVFFDTNVLVYQFDHNSRDKREIAQSLIERSLVSAQPMISTQVVQEFINVASKKFTDTMTVGELSLFMSELLSRMCRHEPSMEFYERAVSLFKAHWLQFYDALIIQAAIDLGCTTLYSEDLQDGQKFGGLTIVNPFK